MKKLFFLALAVLGVAACQVEELAQEQSEANDAEIYASMEAIDATKTSMDQNNDVLWSEGDQIMAFLKTTKGVKYQIKEQYVGTSMGGFSKVDATGSGDDLDPGQDIDHNVAVYPYSDALWCLANDGDSPAKSYKMNVVLPQTQSYAENSFADDAFPMVAVSSSNRFTFKNICGGIKLQLKGDGEIKSIKLEGLENEKISGKASVIGYADGTTPSVTMTSQAFDSVTLDCGDGVQLTPELPTTFIITVPPVEFKSGMKITVTDTDGDSRTFTNTSANTVKRSTLLTFPAITYSKPAAPVPAELINASEYAQATSQPDVYNVKIRASLVDGICTFAPFDLACCLNVIGDVDADHKVSFEVIEGMADIKNPVTAVLPLDDSSVGEVTAHLERNNSLFIWKELYNCVKVKATLIDGENPIDDAVLVLNVEDPLEFYATDIQVSRFDDRNTEVKVYQGFTLKSTVEEHKNVANLLNVNAASFADILPYEYAHAYGITMHIDLLGVYFYDNYGYTQPVDLSEFVWDSDAGILTVWANTSITKTIYADLVVIFTHDFIMRTCETRQHIRIAFRK